MPSLQQGGTCGHPACKEVRRTVKLHSTRTPSTAPLASNVQGAVVHVYEGGAGHNAQFGAYRAADRFSAPRGEFLLLLPPQPIEHFIASARGQRDGRGLAGTWQVGKIIKGYDMVCFLARRWPTMWPQATPCCCSSNTTTICSASCSRSFGTTPRNIIRVVATF